MRGLTSIPKLADLAQAANLLQDGPSLSEELIALYTQWARYDPRFAEILVSYLSRRWKALRTGDFLGHLSQQPWPRAAAVIIAFAAMGERDEHLRAFADQLMTHTPAPAGVQLFFIPTRWPNPVVLRKELAFNVDPYRRAGFIGSQSLLARARWPDVRTRLDPSARLAILKDLLANGRDVTVAEYRRACNDLVSPRQAQRDLARLAKSKGFTRNRRYRA